MDEPPRTSVQRQAKEFAALIDENPILAIERARSLPRLSGEFGRWVETIRAAIFVDAGHKTLNHAVVSEGRAILEELNKSETRLPDVPYNLANALTAEANLAEQDRPAWYLHTLETRARARALFKQVSESDAPCELKGRALTNLGNALWSAYRWVEAYDMYLGALGLDPTNAIAGTGAASMLLRAVDLRIGHRETLLAVASQHLNKVAKHRHRLAELAGFEAAAQLAPLLELNLPAVSPLDLRQAGDYERFVAKHRLALSPTIEGLDVSLKLWDSLALTSVTEPNTAPRGIPPVFAIFNTLKADFLAARWLCYLALEGTVPRTGSFLDTLDYAKYGTDVALLSLAQRASLDVLDKIAVFFAEYLALNEKPQEINFRVRWHRRAKGQEPQWHPGIDPEIQKDNRGMIALSEVSVDFAPDGFLREKKDLRDAGTHRVSVMHDIGGIAPRESRYVSHYREDEFVRNLLDTLRLTRASLIYLVEAVTVREKRISSEPGRHAPFLVPDHHWIRGESQSGQVM